MPYLVDGNNLLGLRPDILKKDPGVRSRLVQRLADFARAKRAKVIVVFDGERDAGLASNELSLGSVSVIFSGKNADADSRILRIIEDSDDPAGYFLVTSDRALSDRARHRRARNIVTSLRFRRTLDEIAPSGGDSPKSLTPDEVADWEAWFRRGPG